MTAAERRAWRKQIHQIHVDARLQRARERRQAREDAEASVTPRERKPRGAESSLPIGRQQGGFWLFAETPEQLEANNALLQERLAELRRQNGYTEPDEPYAADETLDDLELLKALWPTDKDLSDAALDYDPAETQLGLNPEFELP